MAVAVGAPLLDEQQVQIAIAVLAQQVMREAAFHFEAQPRAFARKAGNQRHQRTAAEVFRHAQAQHPLGVLGAQRLTGFVGQPQQPPGVAEQAVALFRGQHLALAAVQQAAVQLLLEPQDLLADGRLRQVQVFGCAREVARIHHGDKAAQQDQIDHLETHWVRFNYLI